MPNIGISALMASFVSSLVQTKVSTASPTRYALPFDKHARRRKTTTRLCRRIDDEEEVLVDVILKDRLDGGMLIVQKMRLHQINGAMVSPRFSATGIFQGRQSGLIMVTGGEQTT